MIGGATKLVALVGRPVASSLSPRMQNAAFAARALDWAYVPLVKSEPPTVKNAAWAKNPIDAFVLAGLEARGLPPLEQLDAEVSRGSETEALAFQVEPFSRNPE